MNRPRQTRPQWKQFLSTVNERLLEGGSVPVRLVNSALKWAFDPHWRKLKDCIRGFVSRHWTIQIAVVVVVLVPFALLLYVMGVFVVSGEEVVEMIGIFRDRLRRRLSEPRRHLLSEKEIAKRREAKSRRDDLKPLPKMRPRALTLRPDGASKEESHTRYRSRVKQKTVDQLGACDLWRFPFEVREAIWKYAVGGNHVHIVKRRQRWGSVYCAAKDPTDPVHRDFCTRRDTDGYHVMSAWPTDTKPLALLVSCRQIYSECIDFLYSHNTFAFDDSALLCAFLGTLLPSRARLITSFHLVPVFSRDWDRSTQRGMFVPSQPHIASIHHLSRSLDVLEQHPKIHSLSVTPKLRMDFTSMCSDPQLPPYMREFVHALNVLKTSRPITLAWPEDPTSRGSYTPTHMSIPSGYWGREMHLPSEDSRNLQLREMPWQSPTVLVAFFTPFDVQCLHCAAYTIIRRATKGRAEVSFLPLSLSPAPPEGVTLSGVLMRYWTFHVFCGGWIEFQYHGERREWSVSQGARRISAEAADRHLAEEGRRYPPAENPHERLRGVVVRNLLGVPGMGEWWTGRGGEARIIDEPTREAYYQNVGWGRGRAQGTG